MTELEIEVDREIRNLIHQSAVAEETATAAVQAAKVAQGNARLAKHAVEQALIAAANKGLHISWWEFKK